MRVNSVPETQQLEVGQGRADGSDALAQADFFIWTQTPAATHFTGFILDGFSYEFDPASPAFGEKFAVPNLPVPIKDFNGNELSRVMSDGSATTGCAAI